MAGNSRPIDWHEQCLENHKKHLEGQKEDLRRVRAAVMESIEDVKIRTDQITVAKHEGREAFDSDTFLVNRKAYKNK